MDLGKGAIKAMARRRTVGLMLKHICGLFLLGRIAWNKVEFYDITILAWSNMQEGYTITLYKPLQLEWAVCKETHGSGEPNPLLQIAEFLLSHAQLFFSLNWVTEIH